MRRLPSNLLWLVLPVVGALVPPAPASELPRDPDTAIDWAKAKQFWAFRAPVAPAPPEVRNRRWIRQPLDEFVLARLEQSRLAPAIEADKRTLIRRVTFDLTGLPPTPEETRTFLEDNRPDAYERLVGRLLASPRFGERLASLWLPLARYAEDQAHQVGSDTKFFYPNAHKYRDWVIDAFNRDLPYDQFIRLQLAADVEKFKVQSSKFKVEHAAPDGSADNAEPETRNAEPPDLAALGFLGLGPKYYNRNRIEVMADEWEDRVDTVTRTLLGLTVACSRCHDHKFDPVTTEDYYALAGVFASTRMVNKVPGGAAPKEDNSEAPPKEKLSPAALHIVEEGTPTNLNVFLRGNVERKGPLAERRFLRVLSAGEPAPFHDGSGRRELAEAIASRSNPLTARVMVNRVWGLFFGRPLVATTSNFGHSGALPTHPELLDDLALRFMDGGWSVKSLVREIVLSSTYRQSSVPADVRRLTSTEARTADAPRPQRVPTTPDSRVHTAGVLIGPAADRDGPRSGRGSDTMRTIGQSLLTSAATSDEADASNELLSHMNRRRLTIEQWRDTVLFVAGNLEWAEGMSGDPAEPTNHLRTVYSHVSRLKLNDLLMQFDYPDANVHAEKRSVTTTATQKLFMLNSPFMLAQAEALAARLGALPRPRARSTPSPPSEGGEGRGEEGLSTRTQVLREHEHPLSTSLSPVPGGGEGVRGESDRSRVRRAYQLLFGRDPEKAELEVALKFLGKPDTGGLPRWQQYAQVLLASNELLYVD